MNGKETNGKGNARKQILTALLATVPTFTYGVQIGWLSPMGKLLKSDSSPAPTPLTDSDISWMATSLLWAGICGIPFASYASDRFGRRICIIGVSVLSCISWLIKLTTPRPIPLVVARVFAGLAAGGCFVVVPVYIKEIAEDSLRGALASLTMTVCKLGVIFVYAVGMTCSYSVNQWVYLSVASAHVVLFFFMPESPNFLLKIGKEQGARKAISWLRSLPSDHKVVTNEVNKLKAERRRFQDLPPVTLLSVVRDRPTACALRTTLILMAIQTLSGCFALINYAADVFNRVGTAWDPNLLALLMGALQLAGSFFTTMSIEKFGRKPPLAISSLVVCICMATLATCFLLQSGAEEVAATAAGAAQNDTSMGAANITMENITTAQIDFGITDVTAMRAIAESNNTTIGAGLGAGAGAGVVLGAVSAGAVCVSLLAYGAGLASVPMVLMAELFTFEMRARMAGASMAFSFFCSSMTVLFYTPVANTLGPFVVFYAFSAVTLFGVIYTVFCVPETKGKSLEDIIKYWKTEPEPTFV